MKTLEEKIKRMKEKTKEAMKIDLDIILEGDYTPNDILRLIKYIKLLEKQVRELKKAIKTVSPMTEIGIEVYNQKRDLLNKAMNKQKKL